MPETGPRTALKAPEGVAFGPFGGHACLSGAPGALECKKCGLCCVLYVPLTQQEFYRIPLQLQEMNCGLPLMAHTNKGFCKAFDQATHLCTIHPSRPGACRVFGSGDPRCAQHQDQKQGKE